MRAWFPCVVPWECTPRTKKHVKKAEASGLRGATGASAAGRNLVTEKDTSPLS